MFVALASLLFATEIVFPEVRSGFMRRIASGQEEGITSVEFFVDPEGIVLGCEVIQSGLSEHATERICDRAMGGDVGRGATGPDGAPIHSMVVGTEVSTIRLGRNNFRVPAAEFIVSVSSMPGDQARMRTSAVVVIDQSGVVSRCEGGSAYADVACSQLVNQQFQIRYGADGSAVSYLDALIVDFVLDEGN